MLRRESGYLTHTIAIYVVFDVYDDGHFRLARFEKWLTAHRVMNWPRTELPERRLLRELRATLHRMRLIGLPRAQSRKDPG